MLEQYYKVVRISDRQYLHAYSGIVMPTQVLISEYAKVRDDDILGIEDIELWWYDTFTKTKPSIRYTNDTRNFNINSDTGEYIPNMIVLAMIKRCCGHFH